MKDFVDFFREQKTDKPIIFCDMDGVIVDLIAGLAKILDRQDLTKRNFDSIVDAPMREKLNKEHPHLFANLPWMQDGRELWTYITQHKVEILSAHTTTWQPNSPKDKKIWVARNLKPQPHFTNVTIRSKKKDYAVQNGVPNILIDDWKQNIKEWEKAGGIGIMHKNTTNTIAALKKLGL